MASWRSAGRRVLGAVSALALVLLGTAFVEAAGAAHLRCGDVVTQSVTLDSDLGPCAGDGLIVIRNGVTVNLNGHRIIGANLPTEERAGIVLHGVRYVTVTNTSSTSGTITGFDAGVIILGGAANKVLNLTLAGNVGNSPECGLGDGLAIFGSFSNIVQGNTVQANGPLSGISVVGPSRGNRIRDNRVRDHALAGSFCGNPSQDIGIRIEGPGATYNTVESNLVERNGLHGIGLHSVVKPQPVNAKNSVVSNTVRNNGIHGQGSGISLMANGPLAFTSRPSENIVQSNVVLDNADDGIQASNGSTANQLQNNRGSGNLQFDGADYNLACDANVWTQNLFVTVNQACVAANGGSGAVPDSMSPLPGATYEVTRHLPPPPVPLPPTTVPPTTIPAP